MPLISPSRGVWQVAQPIFSKTEYPQGCDARSSAIERIRGGARLATNATSSSHCSLVQVELDRG